MRAALRTKQRGRIPAARHAMAIAAWGIAVQEIVAQAVDALQTCRTDTMPLAGALHSSARI